MEEKKLLLFAGTTEGRRLLDFLTRQRIPCDVCVATEYGRDLLQDVPAGMARVLTGRLDEAAMEGLLRETGYALCVDATHPYAVEVTKNIRAAANAAGVPLLRLLRDAGREDGVIRFSTLDEAVEYLAEHPGNVLSTIGSKELSALTRLEGFGKRIFARILPLAGAVEQCVSMGFQGQNLVCMQGPFSKELNAAMLRQFGCRFLLTKNSGAAGGFEEKLAAARETGAQVLLIGRPAEAEGMSYEAVEAEIRRRWDIPKQETLRSHFPIFVPVQGRKVLVVGGGKIAQRRVKTLCRFDWRVKVVSPEAGEGIRALADAGRLDWEARCFAPDDLDGVFLAVAATDDRKVNHMVGTLAQERGVFVSVADDREACSFFFPAVAVGEKLTAGIVGDGTDHAAVSRAAKRIREVLQDEN